VAIPKKLNLSLVSIAENKVPIKIVWQVNATS